MKHVFFNPFQNRLRAGWRILIFFLLVLAALASAGLAMQHLIPIRIVRSVVGFVVIPAIALGTLWLGGRYLDHRRFKDYGFRFSKRWWLDFTFGIILGVLLFCIVFLFEKAMGWVKIVGYFQNQRDGYVGMPFVIPLIMGLVFYIIVGLYEEILFRAYQITNLSEGLNKKNSMARRALIGAYILSAIIFGLFHSGNPNIN
jgi:membrane protease YdiL (CAAX protease family)